MKQDTNASFWGLSPILIFVLMVLLSGVVGQDFTLMPILVAFMLAAAYALAINPGNTRLSLHQKVDIFLPWRRRQNHRAVGFYFSYGGCLICLNHRYWCTGRHSELGLRYYSRAIFATWLICGLLRNFFCHGHLNGHHYRSCTHWHRFSRKSWHTPPHWR